jgi:hypothetical protein
MQMADPRFLTTLPPVDEHTYAARCESEQAWLTGWHEGTCHDYDPTWDYTVAFQYKKHPLLSEAQRAADRILVAGPGGMETARVFPVSLPDERGAVALFVNGTSGMPVILIDIDRHINGLSGLYDMNDEYWADVYRTEVVAQVGTSVTHCLRLAFLEQAELELESPDEAEYGSSRIPF